MKTWTIPVATAQQFVANDYVSACTATIECDLPLDGWHRLIVEFDEPIHTHDGKTISKAKYSPCGYKHDVDINGELHSITINNGMTASGEIVPLDEPIHCYFFTLFNEAGQLVDGHCTLDADGFQSNKS